MQGVSTLVIYYFSYNQTPNVNTPDVLPDPVELLEDGEGAIFVVDKILDKRTYRGKLQYLVKWKGYDESGNQWRYLKDLSGCADAVADFEARLALVPKALNKKKKSTRTSLIQPRRTVTKVRK